MSTSGAAQLRAHGFKVLPTHVDIQAAASGVWVDTGLEIVLPGAGTYHLDAAVRASMNAASPSNVFITARLFDVTANAPVPDAVQLILQISANSGAALGIANNNAAPISTEYTVPGQRAIRLHAAKIQAGSNSSTAHIISDGNGRTTLRFQKVG